jgi:hypothetical protein
MARKVRQTFEEALVAVAPVNARALAEKARRAGELARAYPHCARPFAAVEDRLLQQLEKVISALTGIHGPAKEPTCGLPLRLGLFPGQNPVDAFARVRLELQENLGRGKGAPELVARELRLADAELAPELRLGEIEPADLADAAADRAEIENRSFHFMLAEHMSTGVIICFKSITHSKGDRP